MELFCFLLKDSIREKKQSVLVKGGGVEGGFASLPPLQPIGSKDGVSKSLLANGLNVPNSLVMTPITDGEVLKVCFISQNYYLAVKLVTWARKILSSRFVLSEKNYS